jgi:N-acetylglucosaminyl-diphospho-decaprenol L-rhamnosyltransferase
VRQQVDAWEEGSVLTEHSVRPPDEELALHGVSIVIAVLNQIDYTRRCLESLDACTDIPHEVIIVDNGSTDESAAMAAAAGCRVIRNVENLGCARAWNQGIRAARAPLILIMNNDVIVTPGWLRALVGFYHRSGVAVASPAVINGPLDYDLAAAVAQHQRHFGNRSRRGWAAVCFLTSRRVFERVGLFDERFLRGGFEDDDFDIRLRRARQATAFTGAALIHHFGQITQRALAGATWKKVKNPNKTLLESKWGCRLRCRRVRKELRKLWNRMRFPEFRGYDPYDVLAVAGDEWFDFERGIKIHRPHGRATLA